MSANDRPLSPEELEELLRDYTAGAAERLRRRQAQSAEAPGEEVAGEGVSAPAGAPAKEPATEAPEVRSEPVRRPPPPGTLELVGGHVFFHPPRRGGRHPTISPGPNVEVLVNGVVIHRPVQVRAEDSVEVRPLNFEPQVVYDVDVTADGLEAYLTIHKKPGQVVTLLDAPPATNLRPRGVIQDRPVPPDPTESDVMQELQRRGIVVGIDMDVIRGLVSGELEGRQKVAAGWPPEPSRDARIEYHFEPQERRPHFDPETGRVDWWQAEEVPTVTPGTVLAVKHPPVEGTPGMSVYGKPISPGKPKDVTLRAREGTELSEDGTQVIATREGRPERRGDQFFVLPVLMMRGNIGLETGNVKFRGDVVVAGDVEEQARVESTGIIDVKGHVIRAHVVAQGGARIGQVIGGKVIVGPNAVYRRLCDEIESIGSQLAGLIGATEQLLQTFSQRGSFVPPRDQLIVFLLDKKYAELPAAVEKLLDFVSKLDFQLEIDVRPALETLERYTHPAKRVRVRSIEELLELRDELLGLEESLRAFHSTPAHVITGPIQHADIRATGEVHVLGQGAYHSEIVADGTVVVHGIFRGGRIESKKSVFVGEIGSPAGVKTIVRLEPGRYLCARKVFAGVEVRGGVHPWIASNDAYMTEVYVSTSGEVEVRASQWRPPGLPKFGQKGEEEQEAGEGD